MKYVITADWHLREDRPVCRNDVDWIETQSVAVASVFSYAKDVGAEVIINGDIFHRPTTAPTLVSIFLSAVHQFGAPVYILPGNHDLPYHSFNHLNKSSFGILREVMDIGGTNLFDSSRKAAVVDFGQLEDKVYGTKSDLLCLHQLAFPSLKDMPPNEQGILAEDLCYRFPGVKWILVGDNHKHFCYQGGTQRVVNPGCLLSQASDLIDYVSGFYLIDTASDSVEFVPTKDIGTVSEDHVVKEKDRVGRIGAFVEALEKSKVLGLDIVLNLMRGLPALRIPTADVVKELINEVRGLNEVGYPKNDDER
jgi:hypothetical protein